MCAHLWTVKKRGLNSVTLCEVSKHFFCPPFVFQQICGWGDLCSLYLPQSNSSPEGTWNLGGLYIAPHDDNSIPHLQRPAWFSFICIPGSFINLMLLRYGRLVQWRQNRSKATTAVWCTLLQHSLYRLPQHYNSHLCGHSCRCKHRFVGISHFF